MTKRPVTLHLDEDIVRALERRGGDMSDIANEALRETLRVEAHNKALLSWLDELDDEFGPPTPEEQARAKQVYDEVFRANEPGAA